MGSNPSDTYSEFVSAQEWPKTNTKDKHDSALMFKWAEVDVLINKCGKLLIDQYKGAWIIKTEGANIKSTSNENDFWARWYCAASA